MQTTIEEIKRWFNNGLNQQAKGMILLKNKATGDEYPVYVRSDQSLREQVQNYNHSYSDDVLAFFCSAKSLEEQLMEEVV